MGMIIDWLEEQTLPQALGAACRVFRVDFWHDWEEYEDACTDREALSKHIQSLEEVPVLDAVVERSRLDVEADKIQEELSQVDVEMARLRAKRESLREAFKDNQSRVDEVMTQVKKGLNEAEDKRRLFILQQISATRLLIKESIRQHI